MADANNLQENLAKIDNTYYNQFINYLRNKPIKPNAKTNKHRILPGHAGGTYDSENIILLSYYFHAAAHYVRYLTFRQVGDLKAASMMLGATPEERFQIAQIAGKLGGLQRTKQMLEARTHFYDPAWQKQFADKDAGKRNVKSGWIYRLNEYLSENQPTQRSDAGKLGGKKQTDDARERQTGFFDKKHIIQKHGNLVKWGAKVEGIKIPYKKLSSDFINYYLTYGNSDDFSTSNRKKKKKK